MHYFIIQDEDRTGPFDIITMIKKVRSGVVIRNTMVECDGVVSEADKIVELTEVFTELDRSKSNREDESPRKNYEFIAVFKSGVSFLKSFPSGIAFAALLVAFSVVLGFILFKLPVIGPVIAYSVCYVVYSIYNYYILRQTRGQLLSFTNVVGKSLNSIGRLFSLGLVLTLPFSLSTILFDISPFFVLLCIPGLLLVACASFSPFMVIEHGMGMQDALRLSTAKIFSMGADGYGILFGLLVINFICFIFLIAPIVLSLPITVAATAIIFDDLYS